MIFFGNTFAQETVTIAIDSSNTELQHFQDKLSEKYNGNNYNYDIETGESQNLLERAINSFFNFIEDVFGIRISPEIYKIFETIIYLIFIAVALYFIVRLLVGKKATSFFSKKSTQLAPLIIEEEHIEQINLDHLIRDALAENNFRLAIRYMYLKTLKELSLKNLIIWHYEKTNSDYYNELKSEAMQNKFSTISYLYEHIWYGEFDVDEHGFSNARKEFERFKNLISKNG